jgi:hypothetical protein
MRWLLDADILLKLGRLGLLAYVEKMAEESGVELNWLGSAFYTLGLHKPTDSKTIKRCGRAAVVKAIIEFSARQKPVELSAADLSEESRDYLGRLMSSWNISEGEALLFVEAASSKDFVVTDDVRAIDAVNSDPSLTDVKKRLRGRWLNLLEILAALIRLFGFDPIKASVVNDLDCDTAVRAIFGSGAAATAESVSAALEHYIADRRKKAPELYFALST